MRSAAIVGSILVVALAACTPPAPLRVGDAGVDRSRNVTVPPAVARERLLARFETLGFEVSTSIGAGAIRAETKKDGPQDWASCPTATATDPSSSVNRFSSEQAQGLRVLVIATMTQISGTTIVSLEPRYFGQYVNPYTNTGFERDCLATGVLEKQLLDAAAAG